MLLPRILAIAAVAVAAAPAAASASTFKVVSATHTSSSSRTDGSHYTGSSTAQRALSQWPCAAETHCPWLL